MNEANRRQLLLGAAGAGLLAFACSSKEVEEDVAPPEDLMREHGALNRILLVYEECTRRLESAAQPAPVEPLAKSADIVKRFIEDYHEKLEEDFLFPRFERANKLVDLVKTLRAQHAAGRTLTDTILQGATNDALAKDNGRRRVADALRSFIRMYRPHEAREDTILFPALRSVVSAKEFHELGDQFEDKEHELFGKEGFEGVVTQIEGIEKGLGLYELNQFTPVSRG
jgi:hemerythrin-like domain-containing protein